MWAIFYVSKWLFCVKCDATNLMFRWDWNCRQGISVKFSLRIAGSTHKQSCQQHPSHQNIQNSKVSWLQSPCSQTNKSSQFFQTAWSILWSCPLWSHPPSVRQRTKSWLWKQHRVIVEAETMKSKVSKTISLTSTKPTPFGMDRLVVICLFSRVCGRAAWAASTASFLAKVMKPNLRDLRRKLVVK